MNARVESMGATGETFRTEELTLEVLEASSA
jgi:hypothetical protein